VQKVRTEYQTFSNTVYSTGSRTRTEWRYDYKHGYFTKMFKAADKLGYRYTRPRYNPQTRADCIERIVNAYHTAKHV
jgi:hypothetical protein